MIEGGHVEKGEFLPNDATLAAWEARNYLLAYRDSEPESEQSKQALAASHEAFERTVRLTQPALFKSVLLRTGNDHEGTSDIIQETYTRAYKHLHKFRGDSQVSTWLHSIAFNNLVNYYKKQSRALGSDTSARTILYNINEDMSDQAFLDEMLDDDPNSDPERVLEIKESNREALELVLDAISKINPRHRAVVEMHYVYHLSHEQIAEKLGVTVTNTKVILHRVREKLRKARDKNNRDEE